MTNFTKKVTSISLLLALLMTFQSVFAKADNVVYLKSRSGSSVELSVKLPEFKFNNVNTNQGVYKTITGGFGSAILKKGAPELLKITTTLQIPHNNVANVQVVGADYEDFNDVLIAPSKGVLFRDVDPATVPYTFGKEYNQDKFFPENLTKANNTFVFRRKTGQTVEVYPFQYNPVKRVLRVYKSLELKVTFAASGRSTEKFNTRNTPDNNLFEGLYDDLFINNSKATGRYNAVDYEGKMLVVAHADFADEMADFVTWKNQRGQETKIVTYTEIGGTKTKLREYIKTKYTNEDIAFVLLVGDSQHIPSDYKSGDSDNKYGYIEGNDSYPEVIMGRFSAETEGQVTTMVKRTIAYERDLDQTDTWLANATGIASDEGGYNGDNHETDIQHMDNISTDLTGHGYTVKKLYDPGVTRYQVSAAVNNGNGVMGYVGHGSNTAWVTSYFGVNDIDGLTNKGKWPFIFDVACVNGNFVNKTCFAEKWIRASKDNEPTGAVAIIASTINQSWAPPMSGQDEMYDLLVKDMDAKIRKTFGGVTLNGCMRMNEKYGGGGNSMTDTWTIFGDPSLILRTKAPVKANITHADNIFTFVPKFIVNCSADGALAVISENGKIISKAYVTGGKAEISTTGMKQGNVTLTITGQDMITYTKNLTAIQSSLVLGDLKLKNDNDGRLDPGESAVLVVPVINSGKSEISSAAITMSFSKDILTLTEASKTASNIAAGATVELEFAVTFPVGETKYANLDCRLAVDSDIDYTTEKPFEVGLANGKQIGGGTITSSNPFNRVKKYQRSQFLYDGSKFGVGDREITYISLNIKEAKDAPSYKNFKVLMKEVDASEMSAFVDMSDAEEVYTADVFSLSETSGLRKIDISGFTVTSGKNIVIEFIWGHDEQKVSNLSPKIYCSEAEKNCAAISVYDTNGSAGSPALSKSRPDIYFGFEMPKYKQQFNIVDVKGNKISNVSLFVNNTKVVANSDGKYINKLLKGDYKYKIEAIGFNKVEKNFTVASANVINVTLQKTDPTSVKSEEENIVIYPNPVKYNLNIKITNKWVGADVFIINSIGVTVYKGRLDVANISVTDLKDGMYFVRLSRTDGKVITRKIIIKK